MFAPPVNRLITELARLPGIGQRTAQRLAFHILRVDAEDALPLADAIREVKETVGHCEVCFNLAVGPHCRICEDARRDAELICVVEEPGWRAGCRWERTSNTPTRSPAARRSADVTPSDWGVRGPRHGALDKRSLAV